MSQEKQILALMVTEKLGGSRIEYYLGKRLPTKNKPIFHALEVTTGPTTCLVHLVKSGMLDGCSVFCDNTYVTRFLVGRSRDVIHKVAGDWSFWGIAQSGELYEQLKIRTCDNA